KLEYLRKSGLVNNEWKVIVEVHYYRDRNPEQTKFHKDTEGQTLFVNLNFLNEAEISGPELILNPATSPEYQEWVESGRLPKAFLDDLKLAKERIGESDTIVQTVVPKKGVVAFVDEAAHHKTPTMGHRTVNPKQIDNVLKSKFPEQYADAKQAYKG